MTAFPAGAAGYAAIAGHLAEQYEALRFEAVHSAWLPFIPMQPGRALDAGAGTGRDAAWYAARGWRVIAVEPVAAFREHALAEHDHPNIEWREGALPELHGVEPGFDLITVSAVWMHLDRAERPAAMRRLTRLLQPGGRLFLSVRDGPSPFGRPMHAVPMDEPRMQAEAGGLITRLATIEESVQRAYRAAGVTWRKFVFERPEDAGPASARSGA